MAEATLAGFRERFAEFDTTSDATVELALEEAKDIHAVNPLATLYCAAHLLAKASATSGGLTVGGVGEVVGAYASSLRVQYRSMMGAAVQSPSPHNTWFASTSYGARFLILEKRTPRALIGAVVSN